MISRRPSREASRETFANATVPNGPASCPPGESCIGEACGGAGDGSTGTCVTSCPSGQTGATGGVCQNLICSSNCSSSGGGGGGGTPNTCSPQGSVGEACGNNGSGGSSGVCQDTGDCGGGCHGVCGTLCCITQKNNGNTSTPGQSYNGEPCGNNGSGLCEGNAGDCPTGTSTTQTPGGNNGVCQNLVCCTSTPKSSGASYAGEPCGSNGSGGSSGVCEVNAGDCPSGTGTTQTPGGNNGVCQNLVCCSGAGGKPNPVPTKNTACLPDPSKPTFTSCVLSGQGCTQSANGGIAVGHLAETTPLLNCSHPFTCIDKGVSASCPKPVIPVSKTGTSTTIPPVTNNNQSALNTGQVPATGGGAGGGAVAPPPVANTAGDPPGASCVDGNITGQCAAPLAGATIGDCTNIGSSVSSTTCASHFCCLKTVVSCKAKGGVCQTKNTACANFVSGGNTVCSNLCSAGYTASGPDDCNLSTNPNNAQCCMPMATGGGSGLGQAAHSTISLHAHLAAVGHGTNADGTAENANPQNKTITGTLSFLPLTQTQSMAPLTATDTLTYNPQTGNFENPQFSLVGLGIIVSGKYRTVFHVNKYVDSSVTQSDTIQTIALSQYTSVAPATVTLVPGDIAPASPGDNIIDIQDYNTMVSCMSGNSAICSNPVVMADLNDDGVVDQKDLDLLESNFGSLGASFKIPKFMCEQDPSCGKGSSSLQLCPLQCKIQNIRE